MVKWLYAGQRVWEQPVLTAHNILIIIITVVLQSQCTT